MKNNVVFWLACLALAACEPLHLPTGSGGFRMNRLSDGAGQPSRFPPDSTVRMDTVLFLSAVRVQDGYDWLRDTACGAAEAQVLLLRDYEPICTLQSGYRHCVSTDPDTHHLLDGHLYTEFATEKETVIKRDGEELFRYEGREKLRGLLLRDGALYTLGQDRSGNGCTLRRNGTVCYRSESGRIAGDFHQPGFGKSGALYEQGGHLYFTLFPDRNDVRTCCLVKDNYGTQVKLPPRALRVWDLRAGPSGTFLLYADEMRIALQTPSGTMNVSPNIWTSACLLSTDPPAVFCNIGTDEEQGGMGMYYRKGSAGQRLEGAGYSIMALPDGTFAAALPLPNGSVRLLAPDGSTERLDSCLFFSHPCLSTLGKRMTVALSPTDTDASPFVWENGKRRELGWPGFLTGAELALMPSN